jgi:hypothetical protein
MPGQTPLRLTLYSPTSGATVRVTPRTAHLEVLYALR